MSETETKLPVGQPRLVRGCVEITAAEIRREGVDVPFQSVLYHLAAKKGCPMAGVTCPKLRNDYQYRITHYAEGRTSIEWEWNPTVNANTTNA